MARGRARGSQRVPWVVRLPVLLSWRAFCMAMRLLWSLQIVRVVTLTAVAALLLLVVEGAALARYGPRTRTGFEAMLAGAYALTLMGCGWAWWRLAHRRRLRLRRFEALLALTPARFEHEVGNLLRDLDYRDVRRTGGAGDLAADLCCTDKQGRSVVVQCKRYAPGRPVRSGEMQLFIGMVTVHHQADRGVFVTTSGFTDPARQLAEQHGVELLDGARLARLLLRAPGET